MQGGSPSPPRTPDMTGTRRAPSPARGIPPQHEFLPSRVQRRDTQGRMELPIANALDSDRNCGHRIQHVTCERLQSVVPSCNRLRSQPEATVRVEDLRSCRHAFLLSVGQCPPSTSLRGSTSASGDQGGRSIGCRRGATRDRARVQGVRQRPRGPEPRPCGTSQPSSSGDLHRPPR